ncbi:MAG TPA: sulfatase-like hydrolase/transferase, partial [Thermoanaerobaculia bacterium]|nr:sulfatase-like hydrolase/transferase [Thermoanaerobaculia bacterium]
ASAVCRSGLGDLLTRSMFNDGPRMPLCSPFTAAEVTDRAIRFIERTDRPYFLAVNYLDGHDPYYVPPKCRDRDYRAVSRAERESVLNASPDLSSRPDPAVARRIRAQYRRALNCMDRSLGRLLATVERDPNTIIAFVGDHGEQFGRHGFGGHGNSVYRQVLHVPLAVRIPRSAPVRITDPVSITDLYVTLVRASDPARRAEVLPLFDAASRRPVLSSYAYLHAPDNEERSGFSVVRDEFHFIHSTRGEELYRYLQDPKEVSPVSIPTHRETADTMRENVQQMRTATKPATWKALGYLN